MVVLSVFLPQKYLSPLDLNSLGHTHVNVGLLFPSEGQKKVGS